MKTNIDKLLTPKQKNFCDEYLIDLNATRAALRAGYSKGTALNGQLMTLPKIKLYLQERTEELAQKVQVNQQMVLAELCKVAFANMSNYFADDGSVKPLNTLTEDDKAALCDVAIGSNGAMKFKLYNKMAALEKIARHLNFYKPDEKKPEKVYVYLDKNNMTADDRFDDDSYNVQNYDTLKTDVEVTEAELPPQVDEPDEYTDGPIDEDITFVDGAGISYGPHNDRFKIDLNEPVEQLAKKIAQGVVAEPPGWGEPPFGRRRREREVGGRYVNG